MTSFIFPRFIFPKATKNVMNLAGLLTCSRISERLPIYLFRLSDKILNSGKSVVRYVLQEQNRTYSSGYCFGFAPNSLFVRIMKNSADTKIGTKIDIILVLRDFFKKYLLKMQFVYLKIHSNISYFKILLYFCG